MEPIQIFSIHLLLHGWKSGLWEAEYRELIKMFCCDLVEIQFWEAKFIGSSHWDVFEYICCDMVEIWFLEAEFMEDPIKKVLSNLLWHCWNLVFGNLILWKPMNMFLRNFFDNLKFGFWEAVFSRTDQDVVMLWANAFLWQCEFAGEGEGFQHMEANMALVNCSYFSSADDSHLCSCNSLHHLWFNILPCFCWHIKAWQQFAWLQSKACMNVAASISITLPRGTWTNYKTRFHPVTFLLQIS